MGAASIIIQAPLPEQQHQGANMPSTTYNPYDWYWLADDGRVFASARQVIVDGSDPDYVAWGNVATIWPRDEAGNQTNAALQDVIASFNMFVDLTFYTADSRWRRQTGGITVAGVAYRTDRVSENERNAAYNYSQDNPAAIFHWKLPDGTFATLDATQLGNVAAAEGGFVQACFTCEKNTVDAIAGATITTRAEVDAAFAAISNVFP
jgi:hypothetical protein